MLWRGGLNWHLSVWQNSYRAKLNLWLLCHYMRTMPFSCTCAWPPRNRCNCKESQNSCMSCQGALYSMPRYQTSYRSYALYGGTTKWCENIRSAHVPRHFKVWIIIPALMVLISLAIVVVPLKEQWTQSLGAFGVISLSVPVYFVFVRERSRLRIFSRTSHKFVEQWTSLCCVVSVLRDY